MKKIAILILVTSFSLFTLNACNTIAGAGKDIQGAGQVIQKEAQHSKNVKPSPPKNSDGSY